MWALHPIRVQTLFRCRDLTGLLRPFQSLVR